MANPGDTIYLNGRTYLGFSQITINKPINIIGANRSDQYATLNGMKTTRILFISYAKDVNLTNIKFTNAYNYYDGEWYTGTYEGGAIYCQAVPNLKIFNCIFTKNFASTEGGAIYITDRRNEASTALIENCTFIENEVGGFKVSSGGAVFLNTDFAHVRNCTFISNSVIDDVGGAITISGESKVSNSTFINNTAKMGGAVKLDHGSVFSCRFENNRATSGSAIKIDHRSTIDGCIFKNNYAESEGAILVTGSNDVISNSQFINNQAGRYGAAIYSWAGADNIKVDNCQFRGNTANVSGAIFFVGKNCQISNSLFENNKASSLLSFGGAICLENSGDHTSITNCTFKKNSASIRGGAIYWMGEESKKAIIADSTFERNSANYGGAITIVENLGLIANSTFEYNSASYGGAIDNLGNISLIADSTFRYNKANSVSLTEDSQEYAKVFTFKGEEDYINAIKNYGSVNFQNVTYWDGSFVTSDSPINSNKEAGINITIVVWNSLTPGLGKAKLNITKQTNINGQVFFDEYKTLPYGVYSYEAYHPDDSYYTGSGKEKGTFISLNYLNNTLKINVADAVYGEDLVVNLSTNVSGNYTIYLANSSYDVTFSNDDVKKGNVLAYNVTVAENELNGKIIRLPALLDVKDGYGAYVQFTKFEEGEPYMYTHNRTSFNVYKASSSLDANGTTIVKGSDAELNYTAENGTVTITGIKKGSSILYVGIDYNFTVSDGKVIVTGLDVGNYTVKLSTLVDKNHKSASKEVIVRVITPTWIDAPEALAYMVGEFDAINAVLNPSGAGSLDYTSNNESVVVVDSYGNLEAKAVGTTTVFISFAGNDDYAPSNATVTVTVSDNRIPTSIKVNDSFDLYIGNQVNIGAVLDPSNAGVLDYASSNESVVAVDEDGNMVAVGVGEANITVSFAGNENYFSNSTKVLVTVHPLVDLQITKKVNVASGEVHVGDQIEFTIEVHNHGPCDATEVVVEEALDSHLALDSSQTGIGTYNGKIWNISNLRSGYTAVLAIVANVTSAGDINNYVSVSCSEHDSNDSNNADNISTIKALSVADLRINKTVDKKTVKVGDLITYTVNLVNLGPFDATDIDVYDSLSSLVEFVSASPSVGTYDNQTNKWHIDKLAANSPVTLDLTVRAIANGTIENSVIVRANEYDPEESDNSADAPGVVAEPVVDLSIVKTVDIMTPYYGDAVTYTITVTNNGPNAATDVVVTDTVPSGMNVSSADDTYVGNGVWEIASIDSGSEVSLTLYATVNSLDALTNEVNVTSKEFDNNTDDNKASAPEVKAIPVADLSVSISLSSNEVNYDDIVELVVTVKNNCPNDASGVIVKNTLPDGLVYVSDNITDSDYLSTKSRLMASSQGYDSSSGEWSVGDLANGDEASISILAKASFVGTKEVKSTVSANELKASKDYSTKLTVDPVSDLAIDISVDKTEINVGDEVTYTITVSNNGPNDSSGVKVTDSQLVDFTFVSASSDDYDSSSGVWSVGELSNGSSVKLTVTVKIDNAGNYSNYATVSVNGNDVNSSNDEASSEIVAVTEAENNNSTDDNNNTKPDNGTGNNETVPDNGNGEDVNPDDVVVAENQGSEIEPALAKTGNPVLLVLLAFAMIISTNLGRRRK